MATQQAYGELVKRFTRMHRFGHALSILSWDEMVNLAPGGVAARGAAKAELEVLIHDTLTSESTRELFGTVEASVKSQPLATPEEAANFREMQRLFKKATKVPSELVEAISNTVSAAQSCWGKSRAKNDWDTFLPDLKKVIELKRQEAKLLAEGTDLSPYEALVDAYEPGMRRQTLDRVFNDIRSWLPALLKEILEKQPSLPSPQRAVGPFSIEQQRELGIDIMKNILKFDFDHGRLDVSKHPFCGGVPEDVRLTTRYSPDTFDQSLMGTIHETGHSKYEQNRIGKLPSTQPICGARSAGVHESQSLFCEMQIARSGAFMKQLAPLLLKHFPDSASKETFTAENLQLLYTRVNPGLIRVDADEVCYPLHVLLRYEIEVALIDDGLAPEKVPEVWAAKMKEYLGIDTVGNFKDGPMQDIHWSIGYIGYFPTYTLGAVYAAQLMAAVKREVGAAKVESAIAEGKLEPIFDWLKEKVWHRGSFPATGEILLEEATGEPINTKYYKEHLIRRYLTREP